MLQVPGSLNWTKYIMSQFRYLAVIVTGLVIGVAQADDDQGEPETPRAQIVGALTVQPASMKLTSRRQPHSILVIGRTADGQSIDLTSEAAFSSGDSKRRCAPR